MKDKETAVRVFLTSKSLQNIIRFSVLPKHIKQSVGEHSYSVAMLSLLFAKMEESGGEKIDYEALMRKSLLHDFAESVSGDVLNPFKKRHSDFIPLYELMCDEAVRELVQGSSLEKAVVEGYRDSKDSSIEGRLIAAADIVDPLVHALQEYSMGNEFMAAVINNCTRALSKPNIPLSAKLFAEEAIRVCSYREPVNLNIDGTKAEAA